MEERMDILESLGCGFLLFDQELKVSHANARAGEVLEIPPAELTGCPIREIEELFSDRQGRPLPQEWLLQSLSRKKRIHGAEVTRQCKTGTFLHLSLNASPLLHPDATIKGAVIDFAPCCRREERLQQFIGAMDEIVFEFDAEGHYLNVWAADEDLLKVPARELPGRRFDEYLPREMARAVFDAFRTIGETGEPQSLEYSLDVIGGRRWFLARIALVPPTPGREATFSFLARDITAQKQTERNLRDSERRFRGLFENAATGIAFVGLDGRCLQSNQCLCEILGYSAEELREKPFSSYSHPEDLPADLEQFERMLRGEIGSYRLEKRFFRKSGGQIWGHLTAALQRDDQGAPDYCIAILEDITRRKRAEEEKEHLLGEMEAIFASAGDGIVFYDEKGNILRLNEAARDILGYTDGQLRAGLAERYGQWAPRRPDGSVLPLEESPLFRVFQGQATRGNVAQFTRRDGRKIWITFSASPVFDSGGRQIGAVSTLTDITRLRELQDSMEDYLHMVAHDLRTPLTVISGHAGILEGLLREPGMQESIEAILGASDLMQSMMEDLVELGRLESGQVTLHQDLIHVTDFLIDFLKRQIPDKARRIRTELPTDLPAVQIGINHLRRMLENLVGNALKYSSPEQPVEIGGFREEESVCITVRDYGQGIAPEDLPRIFDRFYRSDTARQITSGTGMGLYITRKLLEAYGGTIRVESAVGRGSTFTLCLPRAGAFE